MFTNCKQGKSMKSQTISVRLKAETYLLVETLAAEQGLSPGLYLKKKLENDSDNLLTNIELIQIDLKEILELLAQKEDNLSFNNDREFDKKSTENLSIVLETLLILREIASPQKLNNAQKRLQQLGIKAYNSLEN